MSTINLTVSPKVVTVSLVIVGLLAAVTVWIVGQLSETPKEDCAKIPTRAYLQGKISKDTAIKATAVCIADAESWFN